MMPSVKVDSAATRRAADLDFLGYRGVSLHPYPATMPYPLAAKLIGQYSRPGDHVLDLFAGSGTTLRAAVDSGRTATGIDINPLATLIARVSTRGFDPNRDIACYQAETRAVLAAVSDVQTMPVDRWTPRLERWFAAEVRDDLARLAAAIVTRKTELALYDFLLLAFSRTVRATSLARQGELKLWRRSTPPQFDALSTFFREANDLTWQLVHINLQEAATRPAAVVLTGDSACLIDSVRPADAIITSPPYGDSWTTVAYGNFTLLSRIWLSAIEAHYVDTDPSAEDTLSLGGSNRKRQSYSIGDLRARSPELDSTLDLIESVSVSRAAEVGTFLFDLLEVLSLAATRLARGGHLVIVLGPRRVSGIAVDTGLIVGQLLGGAGFLHVDRSTRRISGKRLPTRTAQGATGVADTINYETIDVLRGAD